MFEKVLLVDDDVDIRSRFYEVFSSLGYSVTCVPAGAEALIRLSEERPDIIILDEEMPELGGIDTARKIREFDKDIKIIILSEKDLAEDKEKIAKSLNIREIIKKDFSTHFMMKKILEILKEQGPFRLEESHKEKRKGTILVVDDNPEIRNLLLSFLEKRSYKVFLASSGEEALMKINIERPQIALLDIRMPGMDGIMVIKQIKQLDKSIKVVMLTSAGEEHIMQEAKNAGACDYLIKPCDLNKLEILIESILLQK
jgi:two-component system response regulator (stage 0 sporulation protein F)